MLSRETTKKLWARALVASHRIPSKVELNRLAPAVERFARLVEARALENVIRNNTYDCIDSWNVPVLGRAQIVDAARKARAAAEGQRPAPTEEKP